jgi:DNA-binding NarL/FixJ family response regulator
MLDGMPTPLAPYTILVVDDMPAVREALRWAFEDAPDIQIIGEAADGLEALARAGELQPEIVILDIELPKLNGLVVTQALKAWTRAPAVVHLTVHGDGATRRASAAVGSDAFVEKGTGWPALLTQIREVGARARSTAARRGPTDAPSM